MNFKRAFLIKCFDFASLNFCPLIFICEFDIMPLSEFAIVELSVCADSSELSDFATSAFCTREP